jgi:hypothetical protein
MLGYGTEFIKIIVTLAEQVEMDGIKRDYFTCFQNWTKFSKWPLWKRTATAKAAGKTRNWGGALLVFSKRGGRTLVNLEFYDIK